MSDEYVVPPALRTFRFVPRAPGSRRPVPVTSGAFRAAGLPVPEDPRQHNAYQLSERQGWPWSEQIDAHVRRFGAELLGHGRLILVDVDVPMAVDGTAWVDVFRWLVDRAVEAGEMLDFGSALTVRSPGHPDSGHLPGWHFWWPTDPDHPVRMGPLAQCRWIELKRRGTCPGSPGYVVEHAPDKLPVLPRWLAELAGRPRPPVLPEASGSCSPARAWRRMHGMVVRLLETQEPGRNNMLFTAARLGGELGFEFTAAEVMLLEAADRIGLVRDDGEPRVRSTIRSGYMAGAQQVTGGAA